MVRLRWF